MMILLNVIGWGGTLFLLWYQGFHWSSFIPIVAVMLIGGIIGAKRGSKEVEENMSDNAMTAWAVALIREKSPSTSEQLARELAPSLVSRLKNHTVKIQNFEQAKADIRTGYLG